MYWTDVAAKVIKRARLDGSQVTTLIQDGLQIPGSAIAELSS